MNIHRMVRTRTEDSGAEEWECPTCGRRVLMRWPPDYSRTVLDHGDPDVPHSGATGVRLDATTIGEQAGIRSDDRAWLEGIGISWEEPGT